MSNSANISPEAKQTLAQLASYIEHNLSIGIHGSIPRFQKTYKVETPRLMRAIHELNTLLFS